VADDAVGRFNTPSPGWTIVAFSTISVAKPGVEGCYCVALLAGNGVMCKYLGCGSGGRASTTVRMTNKAFGSKAGIMAFY
jgi:hypothetical protein